MKKHQYKSTLTWTGNTGEGTADYRSYKREFIIQVEGKPDLIGSSDPSFRGNKKCHNPEELFLASISSCHMLWYLHLCSDNGITVVEYKDRAVGVMIEEKGGTGFFESVMLRPEIEILELDKKELAMKLHHKANEMCFIANSCNFKILHEPIITGGLD
jgi:organic hydroperoxide reductase OsmC/OhrA